MMTGHRVTNVVNLSAVYAVIFGAYIFNPYSDLFAYSPTLYAPMTDMVDSELLWGGLMMGSGIVALVLSFKGKTAAQLVMFFTFLAFAVLFFWGDFARPGGALFGALALFNLAQWRAAKWNQTLFHRNG